MWDFLRMGGYGPYVWSAYGITLLLLVGLVVWTVRLRRLRHRELAEGSVERLPDGTVRFRITDTANEVSVEYRGLLPDLFREGQGVVALGTLRADGTFVASEVLAKHDENYMPPEVAEALKRAGYWEEGRGEERGGKP